MRAHRVLLAAAFSAAILLLPACGPSPRDLIAGIDRDRQYLSASDVYGPLRVRPTEWVTVESKIKPWAGWWLPYKDDYLFAEKDGRDAPLQKYDRISKKAAGRESRSAKYEEQNLYFPNLLGWEGRCDAWAFASILVQPEPSAPIEYGGVTLSVGDQKALAVKSYEVVCDGPDEKMGCKGGKSRPLYFGQKFEGTYERSNWDDIYPDQFHRVLRAELFEKGRPFILDNDPGIEVWNTPVWYADMRIVERDKHTLAVTVNLAGASPRIEYFDYVGQNTRNYAYTYDLHGNYLEDGSFEVLWGEWTDRSRRDHPDYVVAVPPAVESFSLNKEIDPALVADILRNGRPKDHDP